jgi:CO/xanthine dehydrogenase FAD-binding subunit
MRAFSPRSLDEAVHQLAEKPELRPVAGCTDLMVTEAGNLQDLPGVLNLLTVPELRGIRWRNGVLEIGATTTFSAIGSSPEVRETFPILATAASVIGGWQIQNRATIGGNIANASPAGDSLPALLALDAAVVLVGSGGERTMAYSEFHVGYRQTAVRSGEIVGWIRLPRPHPDSVQAFRKVGTREAHAISKVVVAMIGRVEDGTVAEYRLAAGSVAPIPVRLEQVEEAVQGRAVGPKTADLAGDLAAESVRPIDDVRSTAAYRRFALRRVVRRLTLSLFN